MALLFEASAPCNSGDGGDAGAFADTGDAGGSGPVNSTGAVLLLVWAVNFGSSPVVTDSKGNNWELVASKSIHSSKIGLWRATGTLVLGSGHTFRNTMPGASGFPSISVMGFDDVDVDVQAVMSSASGSSLPSTVVGPVTPVSPSLIVTGVCHGATTGATVASPFTLANDVAQVGGQNKGVASAYLIQDPEATVSATWSFSPNAQHAALIVVFAIASEEDQTPSPGLFPLIDIQAGMIGPLVKIRVYNPYLDEEYVASTEWIQDPVAYWGGFAEASLLMIDDIVYATSDRQGPIQVTALSFEMSDVAHEDLATPRMRSWLGQVGTRALRRCEIWVQMITDPARRRLQEPITVFRGYIEEYKGLDRFRMSFRCLGWIERVKNRPILPTLISELFPTAVIDARTRRVPLALGTLSDEGSEEDPPVFVDDEAGRGGTGGASTPSVDGYPQPRNSFGDITGTPAPTGISGAEVLSSGNLNLGDAEDDEWCIQVTRVRSGVESDPDPFIPGAEFVTLTADGSAIAVSCSNSGHVVGDVYRFYLGTRLAATATGDRPKFHHYIQTSDPVAGVTFTEKFLTPGGVSAINPRFWAAAVWVDDNGRTTPAVVKPADDPFPYAYILSPGYRRIVRFALEPPAAGITHGEMYLMPLPTTNEASQRFEIDVTNLNSNGDVIWEWNMTDPGDEVEGIPTPEGVVPPIYLGQGIVLDNDGFDGWHAFLISGRPCKEFISTYLGGERLTSDYYTTVIAAPGLGWWNSKFGPDLYITIGSHRLYMMFVLDSPIINQILGLEDEEQLDFRVNIRGLETDGDGTGTLVDSGFEQLPILLRQLAFPEDPSLAQPFDQDPQFSDGTSKVNDDAFAFAEADAAQVVTVGPSASRWIATDISVQDLVAEWAVSMRARVYTDESGQFGACVSNPNGEPVYDVDEKEEVIDRSFGFSDTVQGYGQRVPFAYNPRYQIDGSEELLDRDEVSSTPAIEEADEDISLPEHSLVWRRGLGASRQVARSILRESERLPRDVYVDSVLHWLTQAPLGKRISIKHSQAPQAGGWVAPGHIVQVIGKRLSPIRYTVALTCLDLRRQVGELTWMEYEEFMPTTPIGGSRHDSCVLSGGEIVLLNYSAFDVDWDAIPLPYGIRVRFEVAVEAGNAQPGVYEYPDTTADTPVVELATPHTASTFTEYELEIPRPGSGGRVRYWLLPNPTGATFDQVKCIGFSEGYEI